MTTDPKPPRVTIASHYKPDQGGNPLLYVDLDFLAPDGDIINNVKGFKLMSRDKGGFWLAVPQRKVVKDNVEDWMDIFEFGSKSQAEEARSKAHHLYEELKLKEGKDGFA